MHHMISMNFNIVTHVFIPLTEWNPCQSSYKAHFSQLNEFDKKRDIYYTLKTHIFFFLSEDTNEVYTFNQTKIIHICLPVSFF